MQPTLPIRWGVYVAMLLGIYLLRGICLACVVPPLEMWDEYQHLAYVDYVVRTGQTPVYQASRVDPALLKLVLKFPACPSEWRQLSRFGVLTYAQYWARVALRDIPVAGQPPMLYEAQHPPVYYWVVAPIYSRLSGDLPLVVSLLRMINVGFTATGIGAILIWLGRVCRDRRHAALLGLCIVLHPLFLLNADRVANDGLAVMLGSLVIVWTMSLRPKFIALQSLGLGMLIGIAIMTKATNLVLLPFAGFCLILLAQRKSNAAPRRENPQDGMESSDTSTLDPAPVLLSTVRPASSITIPTLIRAVIFLVAGATIFTGHYFLWSLHLYGTITPMQEAVLNKAAHARLADYLAYAPIHFRQIGIWRKMIWHWVVVDGLWVGGWSFLPPPRWMTTVYGVLLIIGVAGGIIARRRAVVGTPFTDRLVGTRILVLCLLMLLAMGYHSIQSMVAWKGTSSTTPWYASVVVPWMLIGALSGAFVFQGTRAGRLVWLVILLVPLLFLITDLYGVFLQMVPRYSGLPFSFAALCRLATLRPSWLGWIMLSMATGAELSLVLAVVFFVVRNRALRGLGCQTIYR